MKSHYPIETFEEDRMVVYYPPELTPPYLVDKITFGTFTIEAECRPHPNGKNSLSLSSKAAKALKMAGHPVSLHVFFQDGTMYIGPLLGIFTAGFTPSLVRPIGERTLFFSRLLSVKKTVGIHAFVFGEEHINWQEGTINGLFFNEEEWVSIEVPFPNVIYDRLPNRRYERKTGLIEIKNRLQKEYLIPWYNPGFFNKLDIYEKLADDPTARQYLPETYPFSSLSLIERMLSDYGHVYLKPVNGSSGAGIHQIIYDKTENHYYCRYQVSGQNRLRKFATLEALFANVFKKRRPNTMLAQQGIHLIRIDQKPVDFRVHTNKDHQGKWNITALAAKIASRGSATTHIRNGGSIKTIQEIFPNKEEQAEIIDKLTEACLTLSKCLEKKVDGIVAEIGFDLGLDRDGKVWLFEANSKPGRSIFKHPRLRNFEILTRKLSLAYSIYLTEQSITQPEEMFK